VRLSLPIFVRVIGLMSCLFFPRLGKASDFYLRNGLELFSWAIALQSRACMLRMMKNLF
jgi:hypothetical protein